MRLIDADALKKRMVNEPVKAVQDVDFQAEWFTRIADTVCHMIDMVDDAPTVEPASPWRSMEDNGPPEEKGPYFVYAPSYRGGSSSEKEIARGVMISKWTGKHWSIEVGYYKRPGCVTHWMPIEPPQEDA